MLSQAVKYVNGFRCTDCETKFLSCQTLSKIDSVQTQNRHDWLHYVTSELCTVVVMVVGLRVY